MGLLVTGGSRVGFGFITVRSGVWVCVELITKPNNGSIKKRGSVKHIDSTQISSNKKRPRKEAGEGGREVGKDLRPKMEKARENRQGSQSQKSREDTF